jgi:hypothetical protein
MTGRFESYRGGPGKEPLPRVAAYLVAVFDAATIAITDVSLTNNDPRERLSRLGPVAELKISPDE